MSELKLLPCPFCGRKAHTDKIGKPLFTIRCTNINCHCEISKNSLENTINAWNTRTPMANIVEKLEYEKERHEKDRKYWSEKSWKDSCIYNECDMSDRKCECFAEAINIVKQEINNGLE